MRILFYITLIAAVSLCGCSREPQAVQGVATVESPPAAKDLNEKDQDGFTPLMRAIRESNAEEARRLLDQGADVNTSNEAGVTALMIAAGMGRNDVISMLIEKGADVNARTQGNYTPLMSAALNGQAETIRLLLDTGADPTIKDNTNKTASSYAKDKNHDHIVEILSQAKAARKRDRAKR